MPQTKQKPGQQSLEDLANLLVLALQRSFTDLTVKAMPTGYYTDNKIFVGDVQIFVSYPTDKGQTVRLEIGNESLQFRRLKDGTFDDEKMTQPLYEMVKEELDKRAAREQYITTLLYTLERAGHELVLVNESRVHNTDMYPIKAEHFLPDENPVKWARASSRNTMLLAGQWPDGADISDGMFLYHVYVSNIGGKDARISCHPRHELRSGLASFEQELGEQRQNYHVLIDGDAVKDPKQAANQIILANAELHKRLEDLSTRIVQQRETLAASKQITDRLAPNCPAYCSVYASKTPGKVNLTIVLDATVTEQQAVKVISALYQSILANGVEAERHHFRLP